MGGQEGEVSEKPSVARGGLALVVSDGIHTRLSLFFVASCRHHLATCIS